MADPAAPEAPGPDEIEAGRVLFAQACEFIAAAPDVDALPPPDLPEVAFAGRSNVGKSSLLNALVGRRALARTSSTPGRTREIIFFDLGGRLRLVDLPGYGYARASKQAVAAWTRLIEDYLRGRPNLRRVLLLIDGRAGLKESDEAALALLDQAAVPVQIVVTKGDKVGGGERAEAYASLEAALRAHPAALPRIAATSALKGEGIAALRATLAALDA